MRGRFRILLGAAAGVGKTYRMLQEGRQAATEGVDVVIGYLEPHDRPETAALAEGLETLPRRARRAPGVALEEMDTDASPPRPGAGADRRARAHERAGIAQPQALPGHRGRARRRHRRHLHRERPAPGEPERPVFELTGVRVRETFPDRVLDGADEVVLVDLTPQELRSGSGPARCTRGAGSTRRSRTSSGPEPGRAAPARPARAGRGRRGPAGDRVLDGDARQAILERILVLVSPSPAAQRLMRRAWRSAQRLGADVDVLWVPRRRRDVARGPDRHARRPAPAGPDPGRPLPRGGVGRRDRGRCGRP